MDKKNEKIYNLNDIKIPNLINKQDSDNTKIELKDELKSEIDINTIEEQIENPVVDIPNINIEEHEVEVLSPIVETENNNITEFNDSFQNIDLTNNNINNFESSIPKAVNPLNEIDIEASNSYEEIIKQNSEYQDLEEIKDLNKEQHTPNTTLSFNELIDAEDKNSNEINFNDLTQETITSNSNDILVSESAIENNITNFESFVNDINIQEDLTISKEDNIFAEPINNDIDTTTEEIMPAENEITIDNNINSVENIYIPQTEELKSSTSENKAPVEDNTILETENSNEFVQSETVPENITPSNQNEPIIPEKVVLQSDNNFVTSTQQATNVNQQSYNYQTQTTDNLVSNNQVASNNLNYNNQYANNDYYNQQNYYYNNGYQYPNNNQYYNNYANNFRVKIVRKKIGPVRFLVNLLSYTLFVLLLIIGLILLVYLADNKIRAAKGDTSGSKYNAFVVLTGSMIPTIDVNDVVITDKVDVETLQVGDIITFSSSDSRFYGKTITHRIIERYYDDDTKHFIYKTKGDGNPVADPALVEQNNILGKVIFRIPKLGYVQSFLATKGGWVIVILIPCLAVLSYDIMKLFKMAGKKAKLIK